MSFDSTIPLVAAGLGMKLFVPSRRPSRLQPGFSFSRVPTNSRLKPAARKMILALSCYLPVGSLGPIVGFFVLPCLLMGLPAATRGLWGMWR